MSHSWGAVQFRVADRGHSTTEDDNVAFLDHPGELLISNRKSSIDDKDTWTDNEEMRGMVTSQDIDDQRLVRRLAAIVAADVVGYSRMMGADEDRTFRALQAHQSELIAPAIAKYQGKIFKTTGDGLLAEFPSIVDAVACAVVVQRIMLDRNRDIPEDQRIVFRIGVNLGDVIVKDGDVFGDGVNVAARIESACEPGGVMISRTAHDHARAKLPYVFADMGERSLKNIALPVGVFGLSPAALAELPPEEPPKAPVVAKAAAIAPPAVQRRGPFTTGRITAALLLLTAIAIAAGLGMMIDKAGKSRAIVIDPFDAPPALASSGLNGKIVASGVFDELVRLQTESGGSAARHTTLNPWTDDPRFEVPDSGLSLAGIERLLRARFGHDVHIGGGLVQTAAGNLELSVRGDGIPSKSFAGPPAELAKLTTQAAEYIHGRTGPPLLANYLIRNGRLEEAVNFAKANFTSTPEAEQPFLLNVWGIALLNSGGDPREALAKFQMARNLKPDFWAAYHNETGMLSLLHDEEGAWRVGKAMLQAAGGRPGKAREILYGNWDLLTHDCQAERAENVEDLKGFGVGSGPVSVAPTIAAADACLHDPADAELWLQTAQGTAADTTIVAGSHYVRGLLAADAGDHKRAVIEMEALGAALADPLVAFAYSDRACAIASAEEAVGNRDKADAALQAGGISVDCYSAKADILDGRGDWAAAQEQYQAAVDLAPDLPAAYYAWGMALARHGDAAGAKAKFAQANERGPHWADPLKAWGDALAKEGNWREAMAKYDAALQYAPAWAALHSARDEAAAHAG